ncbi:hypothetical protein [Aquimarina sp. I32.4]|uniref:hypothetical protein n=1 Tax=Aquimarina sp. I32.4 TaxID=2053903 RepID=UPI000CDECB52|nr:hypothetical protein [Aquimarina sp. I32.4]
MKKPNVRQRVEKWLENNGHLINKNAFEREIEVSKGIIQKHIKYDKKINDQHIKALYKLIKKFKEV